MDPAELAASFDVEDSGLIDIVHQELVEDDAVKRGIKMELYKLNIYGSLSTSLSFSQSSNGGGVQVKIRFSRHTEGSLVVVFLTSYEDGGFVLREYDHEHHMQSHGEVVEYVSFDGDPTEDVRDFDHLPKPLIQLAGVTNLTDNPVTSELLYVAYGDEPTVTILHANLCINVDFPAPASRSIHSSGWVTIEAFHRLVAISDECLESNSLRIPTGVLPYQCQLAQVFAVRKDRSPSPSLAEEVGKIA
ncbi:hypothetical protein BKA82DRAFT_4366331 [Pisolithus tinctorius]|nr:hypothetical protein BKA82DRAFT_4366331 [Pisolithus tinctorius]